MVIFSILLMEGNGDGAQIIFYIYSGNISQVHTPITGLRFRRQQPYRTGRFKGTGVKGQGPGNDRENPGTLLLLPYLPFPSSPLPREEGEGRCQRGMGCCPAIEPSSIHSRRQKQGLLYGNRREVSMGKIFLVPKPHDGDF